MDYIENIEIKSRPLYQGLMGTATVAAVFAVIAAVLLLINAYQVEKIAPQKSGQLRELQKQFDAQPANEALAGQIRSLDSQIRRDELRQQRFGYTGVVFLVVSLFAAAGSAAAARLMLSPAPAVPTQPVCSGETVQRAIQVRTATSVICAVIGAVALFAILREWVPSTTAAPAAAVDWAQQAAGQWPSFRGSWGNGVAEVKDIPAQWSEKDNKNILWKSAVPLVSNSSPIIWGDKILVSAANKDEQKIFCYNTKDGKLLWTGAVKPAGIEGRTPPDIMEDTGFASSTPVTNGRSVCAIFATGDIGCFDMDGKVQWQKALGVPESTYGYAASLAVYDDLVIVQFDQGYEEGLSEMIAIRLGDGNIAWRIKRPTPNTWTSPTVVKTEKGYRILASGNPWVIAYETTGKELWKASCLGTDIAPTQIFTGGLVLAIQPYDKIYAIRIDNPGSDVTQTAMVWQTQGDMPDICSPVSDGKFVWTLTTMGGLSCFDLADGKEVYKQALEGEFHASPSIVEDKLYILDRKGTMIIAQAGREYKEITRCIIDEECFASPAFTEGSIYLRSTKSLYCIGQK